MGSSQSILKLDVILCGVSLIDDELTKELFPDQDSVELKIRKNKTKEIDYTARIFFGRAVDEINDNKDYLYKNINAHENDIPKNVILCFPDKNSTLQQNAQAWRRIANGLNEYEVKLPFIIFLTYGEIEEIRKNVFNNSGEDIFNNFLDKRKISILKLLPGN